MNSQWKFLTLLSLVLNALLISRLATLRLPQRLGTPARDALRLTTKPLALQTTPRNAETTNATGFHWREVESADYLEYIANLRRIGCPEQTLRDIILADVNKLYAPRYAGLARTCPELVWWGKFERNRAVPPELASQLRALNEEKKALFQRLIGPPTGAELVWLETGVASLREQNTFAFLPESKQSTVRDLVSRYQTLRERGETMWVGLATDERDAKEKELQGARASELAAVLTPEELTEFNYTNYPTMLETGIHPTTNNPGLQAQYIEVFAADALAFTNAIWQAHQKLFAPP